MLKLIFLVYVFSMTLLLISSDTTTKEPEYKGRETLRYVYGVHVPGEELSYSLDTVIPAFTPLYTVNVTPTEPFLEDRFTYLIVKYSNPVSVVNVDFNPKTNIVTVKQKFPFMSLNMVINGFSMPLHTLFK